jgi:hypothetical protein
LTGLKDLSHPTYDLDKNYRFMPNSKAKRVNLKNYFDTLRSTKIDELENIRWVFEEDKHSLDNATIDGNYFGLFSFPRCGSTFTRKYIEEITGISTGATLSKDEIGGY